MSRVTVNHALCHRLRLFAAVTSTLAEKASLASKA
jgi:hypothetical protein